MRFGSLFSGIGGFDLAFQRVGMECAWQVEIDKWCNQVLRRHWPDVERHENVEEFHPDGSVDLIAGGFPCQDLSVAGRREGLSGERSGLWHEFHRVLQETRPSWVVIENVTGLLSSNGGRDMGTVVGALGQLGYRWAYRVLDSQYYGVAQRRRRVFIVGHLGDGRAGEVLFEREGGSWNPPTRQETGEGAARSAKNRAGIYQWASGGGDDLKDSAQALRSNAEHSYQLAVYACRRAQTSSNGWGIQQDVTHTLDVTGGDAIAYGFANVSDGSAARNADDKVPPLTGRHGDPGMVAHGFYSTGGSRSCCLTCQLVPPLKVGSGIGIPSPPAIVFSPHSHYGYEQTPECNTIHNMERRYSGSDPLVKRIAVGVRRLTPLECERLQGFPDGWTACGIDEDGEAVEVSDTQRYKQLGNAVTVNVVQWIGRRIMEVAT